MRAFPHYLAILTAAAFGRKDGGWRCAYPPYLASSAKTVGGGDVLPPHIVRLAPRAVLGALVAVLGMSVCCPARAQTSVPDVACVRDPPLVQAPLPKDRQINIELPSSVAAKLEVYNFGDGFMLGPRGWSCQLRSQVGYFILAVLPPDLRDRSYGIVYVSVNGDWGDYKLGNIYSYANAYFPNEMKRETLAGFTPPTNNAVGKYRTDTLKSLPPLYNTILGDRYLSAVLVTYTTPANHLGLGTDILFGLGGGKALPSGRVSSLPIQGFVKLNLSRKVESGDLFAISLPANLSSLSDSIQDYAEAVYMTPLWAMKSNSAGMLQWKQ